MILEDEELDGEDQTPEEKEGEEEQTTYSAEEYKKLRSDKDRGAQKLIKEKKQMEKEKVFYQEAMKLVPKLSKDQAELLEVAKDRPEVAKVILDTYYDGISIEEFEERLTGDKPDSKMDVDSLRKQIKEEVEQSVNQREVKKTINKFIEKASFDEETHEKFGDNFKELIEGKKLNSDNVQKYLKIAYAETVGYEKADSTPIIAKAMSAGASAGGSKSKSKDESLLDDMRKTMAGLRF